MHGTGDWQYASIDVRDRVPRVLASTMLPCENVNRPTRVRFAAGGHHVLAWQLGAHNARLLEQNLSLICEPTAEDALLEGAAIDPTGRRVALLTESGCCLCAASGQSVVIPMNAGQFGDRAACFTQGGSLLWIMHGAGLHVCDSATGKLLAHQQPILGPEFGSWFILHPSGAVLISASAGPGAAATVWAEFDTQTGKIQQRLMLPDACILGLHPSGSESVTYGSDGIYRRRAIPSGVVKEEWDPFVILEDGEEEDLAESASCYLLDRRLLITTNEANLCVIGCDAPSPKRATVLQDLLPMSRDKELLINAVDSFELADNGAILTYCSRQTGCSVAVWDFQDMLAQ